jgi:hypothetical protein
MKKQFIISLLLMSSLVQAEGFKLLDKDSGKMELEGKNESCNLTLEKGKKVTNTNCLKLTNSKNVNILCTPEKTVCKTLNEAKSFFEITIKHLEKEDPRLTKLMNMPYYNARKKILEAGYTPKESSTPPTVGTAKKLYDQGYKEIDDCSDSTPILSCIFKFNAPNSKVLLVQTHGGEDPAITYCYFEQSKNK